MHQSMQKSFGDASEMHWKSAEFDMQGHTLTLCQKLDNHSIPGIHIGIAQGKKAFLIYDPQTHKVHESQDDHFFENTKSILEHVTIEVEPHGSQTHIVIPIEENADHVNERAEDDMEIGSAVVDPLPEPKSRHSEPC